MRSDDEQRIEIDIPSQTLTLFQGEARVAQWMVSTAKNGSGECDGSECTPRGEHRIRIKIGQHCPLNTVFSARRPTGECYSASLAEACPERDWILTRILWLTGCETGTNRGGSVDTLKRFIYIHGCADSEPMGIPASHGCIRMRNEDILSLFDQVETGCRVLIHDRC